MNTERALAHCLLCGGTTSEVAVPSDFKGITSDCKPWPRLGRLLVCQLCGHVQKARDEEWQRDISDIYDKYQIYHQTSGAEQLVFTGKDVKARSAALLEQMLVTVTMPPLGRLLDFGCGNGALLRAFGGLFPSWEMVGVDTNPRFRGAVLSIPGVVQFAGEEPDPMEGLFRLVTMIHVLEHVPAPAPLLERISRRLVDTGLLLIQVPDLSQNPFDIVVRDHCSHFLPETLAALALGAGAGPWTVEIVANEWISREISVILRRGTGDAQRSGYSAENSGLDHAGNAVTWLRELVVHARTVASNCRFGIFGTGIGATWLAEMLNGLEEFFVDEDPSRCGKTYLGKKVIPPSQAPHGSRVYLAFPAGMAMNVHDRLRHHHPAVDWVVPPRGPAPVALCPVNREVK